MVDLTFLKKFTKGDSQKMKRYISLYLEVVPHTLEEMRRNLKDGNWEQLRINAHSLKPQADFMGINRLKEELVHIEEAVKQQQFEVLENLLQATCAISVDSERSLRELLDQL